MGHALLVVILDPGTPPASSIASRIEELMEPYDQDSEVNGREWIRVPCDCVSAGAAPSADCEECHGTGETSYSYNPREAWDWYSIGGSWDQEIRGDASLPTNLEGMSEELARNTTIVSDIPPGFVGWAVLTPDGEWHGGGGQEEKDPESWAQEQVAIFRSYPGHLAIAVDFHY